ncbi:MAG: DEAD/DEAH box helicase [Marinifilaceae bacterium]
MFVKKLDKHLSQALLEAGFEKPTKLQKKTIARIKSGADVLCVGPQTSGRTTAIVISVIQNLKKAVADVPRALIIVPDQEKGEAMLEQFNLLGENTDLRVFVANEKGKIDDLRDRIYFGSDVVIGSSKRLNELYSFSGLNLTDLKMLVIDDAEQVIRLGGVTQVDRLAETVTKAQRVVYTQKMTEGIERFAEEFMNIFEIVEIEEESEE